jgi:hypothetical protein
VNSDVASVLVQMLSDVYEAVHSHYKQDMGDTASEAEILDRIRQQRNLRHGTFLEGDRFRRLFGQTKGTVAEEVMMIPYLLTLTLALDPPRFLRLRSVPPKARPGGRALVEAGQHPVDIAAGEGRWR